MCFLVHSSIEQILSAGFPATILFECDFTVQHCPTPANSIVSYFCSGKIKNLAPIKQFSQVSENDRLLLIQLLASLSQSRNRA